MIETGAAYDSTTGAEARTAHIDVRYLPPPVQQSEWREREKLLLFFGGTSTSTVEEPVLADCFVT